MSPSCSRTWNSRRKSRVPRVGHCEKTATVPPEPAAADDLPPLLKGFGAVPPLECDGNVPPLLSAGLRRIFYRCAPSRVALNASATAIKTSKTVPDWPQSGDVGTPRRVNDGRRGVAHRLSEAKG